MSGVIDTTAFARLGAALGSQARQMIPSLVDDFIKDAPGLISEAERAAQAGGAADLRRAAHTLKSNSASFGATALFSLARELEEKAKGGTCEGADLMIVRIKDEFATASAELKALVEKMQSE